VRKLTAAIFMGVVGIGLLAWPMAFVALSAPADKAVAPIYFKNFLLETLFDMISSSFLINYFKRLSLEFFSTSFFIRDKLL
jgi:hypothetical protein